MAVVVVVVVMRLSQSMYWYTVGYPIRAVPNFELGYHVPSYRCWYIMYYPKLRARISCTIINSELGYFVPSQGMYWYILGQIRDRGPGFGPLAHCRLLISSFQPRSQIWALTCPLFRFRLGFSINHINM